MNKKLVTYLLLLTGCCTLIFAAEIGNVEDVKLETPVVGNVEDVKKKTTSTTTTTTTTTTPAPAPTTTSTKKPETTSPTTTTTTTTTTAAPTTKAPDTTTTTTPPPKTTTVAPTPTPTPTPAPQPYPEPSIGQWNSTCIMLKMAAQLNFTYMDKTDAWKSTLYNIPADAKVHDANCNNVTQVMQINWGPAEAQSMMSVTFEMKNKTSQMSMIYITLPLTADRFPDAKENETIQLIHRGFDFSAPAKMSYHCTRSQKLNLTETIMDKEVIGTLTVHDVQAEAFRSSNSTGFSSVHDCDSAQTSDIVPIAVGIALAALITIVLVAYLCARRRSASRGYMSF